MGVVCGIDLRRAVGMSDLAALLAEAFRFPKDDRLANALAGGSFLDDWSASWSDACGEDGMAVSKSPDLGHGDVLGACENAFEQTSGEKLRREYSRMFLAPGGEVPVWPYESAFLHQEAGRAELPNLFLTRSTIDVERQMAEAGVRPKHLRTEPCDACAIELEFVSFLYAHLGESLRVDEAGKEQSERESAAVWQDRIERFSRSHVLNWMPRFFRSVKANSRISEYGCFSDLGIVFAAELERDVAKFAPNA